MHQYRGWCILFTEIIDTNYINLEIDPAITLFIMSNFHTMFPNSPEWTH